ncbi:hypothetical protein MTAT_19180 [Moorella thermoacetica]|uniref:LexA repressor n=1 Tax=Neomoorella thermoacetica TaxID=1525 RepID=A0AAC9HJ27_NEOTH|nr:helix-turn-helix domain-containing protein [Moorella thermoacetica]AOQ24575.1 LexA repressor [Moorella thermoacetica]TYL12676.1 hypothetical protein MTAT_19180 [Moorella thermoacetica]
MTEATGRRAEDVVLDYLKEQAKQQNPVPFQFEDIAQITGFSVSTVYRAVHSLEKQGYIRVEKTAYKKRPNIWVFDEQETQSQWTKELDEIILTAQRLSDLVEKMRGTLRSLMNENAYLKQAIEDKDREIDEIKTKLSTLREIL